MCVECSVFLHVFTITVIYVSVGRPREDGPHDPTPYQVLSGRVLQPFWVGFGRLGGGLGSVLGLGAAPKLAWAPGVYQAPRSHGQWGQLS